MFPPGGRDDDPDRLPAPVPVPPPPEGDARPGAPRTSGLAMEFCYRHPGEPTGVHCTRCGRPICTECMRPAAVGYQCPDCLRESAGSVPRGRRALVVGGPGIITRALMAINIAVFVVEMVVGGGGSLMNGPSLQHLVDLGGLYPIAVAQGQYWRLITAMFLHVNLLHIAFNMWALYILGPAIENWYGRRRFLILYFLTGFLASVASFVFGPVVAVGVGASGAIFGLLGTWLAYNYRRRENPLASANLRWAMMLIVINLVFSFTFPGIDWRAHVGGLVAGAVAGFLIDGVGTGSVRRLVQVGGPAAMVAVGIVMTLAHVQTIRALFRIG